MFENQTQKLRDDIAKEGKERVGVEVNLRKYLDVDIPKLHLALSEEIQARELMEERILKRARDEVLRLNEAEQNMRREAEVKILQMFENQTQKLRDDIAKEGKERVGVEVNLRKYLDQR